MSFTSQEFEADIAQILVFFFCFFFLFFFFCFFLFSFKFRTANNRPCSDLLFKSGNSSDKTASIVSFNLLYKGHLSSICVSFLSELGQLNKFFLHGIIFYIYQNLSESVQRHTEIWRTRSCDSGAL